MANIILLSSIAGFATLIGAIFVLMFGKLSEKMLSLFLGLAAGIMLAVVVFDLVPSALTQGSISLVIIGLVVGYGILYYLSKLINKITTYKNTSNNTSYFRSMGYLIAIGIALHDLPEGIAIAAGFSAETNLGWLIAVAIGLHNVPEGIAIAAPLSMGGLSFWQITLLSFLVSVFTPLGTFIGLILVGISTKLISVLLALAAGAMLYIVFKEISPEAKAKHPFIAALGAILGIIIILILTFIE